MNLDKLLSSAMTSPLGRKVGASFGMVEATELRRGPALPSGPVVVSSVGGDAAKLASLVGGLGVATIEPLLDLPEHRTTDDQGRDRAPAYPSKIGGVVLDASGATRVADLEFVRQVLRPAVKALEPSGRIVLIGLDPAGVTEVEAAAVQQGLDGIMRSVGKELRAGATCNLIQVATSELVGLGPVLAFLLQGRSAYVDGQPLRLTASPAAPQAAPIAVVTGAARGIGAAIARTLAAQGARVIGVDVPVAGEALASVANELRGSALQLDITAADAGEQLARHVVARFGPDARIDVLVHCAGILRDKMLVNLDEQRWGAVLAVNLAAQLRINDVLLDAARPGGLADGGRIIGVASTSGWAGNRGQTNYAASKAGVMGWVRALAPRVADRGIHVNAVAPGFIETDMTASIPFVEREIFKRSNSLAQAGKPVDVAEAVAFLAQPETPMTGQVLRVCGQLVVGA